MPIFVDTLYVRKGVLYKDLISVGKIVSARKHEIRVFESGYVQETKIPGQIVSMGENIFQLDNPEIKLNRQIADLHFKKISLELEKTLIGIGYSIEDTTTMPRTLLENACIVSGYKEAILELDKTSIREKKMIIKAPFQGVIANVEVVEGNYISKETKLCDLIDIDSFKCSFEVLESDVSKLKLGQQVSIIPLAYNNNRLNAKIESINPYVSEDGMVSIIAILNKNARLFEGMNVKVKIKIQSDTKILIPKKAIVLRGDEEVVFTYKNGVATWNSIKILDQNEKMCLIKGDVQEGDYIIISNNLHLNHGVEVHPN